MAEPRNRCLSPQEISRRLERHGVQPTAQRIAICQYVLCEAEHPTADDIKQWADKNFPKMSRATVYNTVNTLIEAGLLREFRFPHDSKTVYDDNISDHYHFLDETTGEIIDIDGKDIEIKLRNEQRFIVKNAEVLLRGKLVKKKGV